MATVVRSGHRAVVDPLALGRSLGAALAFLGMHRAIPLMHGSQGCAAFAKAFLTKHFREPIPLQATAVTELVAVLGSGAHLVAALDTVCGTLAPDLIGVVTTGVSEVSGEDVFATMRSYLAGRGRPDPLIVTVAAPDFTGGLSDGWAGALTAIVRAALREPCPDDVAGVTPVLAGVSLTARDLDEISWLVEAFGLRPVLVPDLSGSLDGHLAAAWSPLTTGGTTRADLALLSGSRGTHAVGVTTAEAGAALAGAASADGRGPTVHQVDHLSGLAAVDGFVERLSGQAAGAVPAGVRRERARFTDTLLDTHFVLGDARVALALEPEHLVAVAELLAGTGARVVAAVCGTDHEVLTRAACDEVVIGDLSDLRERAGQAGADVVIASSHARDTARAIGAQHLVAGLPVDHRFGAALGGVAGYRGGLRFLTELANLVLAQREQTPRAAVPRAAVPRAAVPRAAVPRAAVPRAAVPRAARRPATEQARPHRPSGPPIAPEESLC
jgi:nitrogenase molybdenum-iron protein NifN